MNLNVLIVSLILMAAIAFAGLHMADDGELVMIGKVIIVIAVVLVAIEVGREANNLVRTEEGESGKQKRWKKKKN